MRLSWVMQDLLLRLGGHGGVKQTKPAEAWPLARVASSSIPTPVQGAHSGFGCLPYTPAVAGESSGHQVRGARLEEGANPGARTQSHVADGARGDGGHERKADVHDDVRGVGGGAHARDHA